MSLFLLLDENISPVVVDGVIRRDLGIVIESIYRWRNGAFVNQRDREILLTAASEGWTLVTYDRRTIPDLLDELSAEELPHSGIVFVDERTVANSDFGLLIRSLISLWERFCTLDWQNRIQFLDKPKD